MGNSFARQVSLVSQSILIYITFDLTFFSSFVLFGVCVCQPTSEATYDFPIEPTLQTAIRNPFGFFNKNPNMSVMSSSDSKNISLSYWAIQHEYDICADSQTNDNIISCFFLFKCFSILSTLCNIELCAALLDAVRRMPVRRPCGGIGGWVILRRNHRRNTHINFHAVMIVFIIILEHVVITGRDQC